MTDIENNTCPDCGVDVGLIHRNNCDVERCHECGLQALSCGCDINMDDSTRLPWSGEWPGTLECREFSWYAKLVPGEGCVACDKDDEGAMENLNRLHEAQWDKELGRFVLRN